MVNKISGVNPDKPVSNIRITYHAAKAVAGTVETHFINHHESAGIRSDQAFAPRPPAWVIAAITDVTFWASLKKEEGWFPKISIAFVPPEKSGEPLIFEQRLAFSSNILTKLAPAVERSGIHLGVWHEDGELYIWGTTREIPALCFVLEVVEPGMLVIKHRRLDGFGKFVNVAVLKGDQVKIIDENSAKLPDCPTLINSMIGFAPNVMWNDSLNILVQLAVSMRNHGKGGILLVVPEGKETWRESIIHPISYSVKPTFCELAALNKNVPPNLNDEVWQGQLSHAINHIAGLTAVDGATIINKQYELMAFGAKIARSANGQPIEEIHLTEPIVGDIGEIVHPVKIGGTRHLSAAQFIHEQHDAIALVASQDGRFTIFSWSPCDHMVQAHRVDALLL